MSEKQPQLNGAYYGPAVPPRNNYHSHGRSRGCGCGCCLLKFLFQLIVTIVVIVGILALIFWLIFRPNIIKFHVTEAELTQFNLTTNNGSQQLYYNLRLNLTIRNPNKKIGVYYDRIEARAYYEGQRFSTYTVPYTFYQGHKNTTLLSPYYDGQQVIVLQGGDLTNFNSDKATGVYNIEVDLRLRVRFKVGKFKTAHFKPEIKCDLDVPLSGATSATFQTKKCKYHR